MNSQKTFSSKKSWEEEPPSPKNPDIKIPLVVTYSLGFFYSFFATSGVLMIEFLEGLPYMFSRSNITWQAILACILNVSIFCSTSMKYWNQGFAVLVDTNFRSSGPLHFSSQSDPIRFLSQFWGYILCLWIPNWNVEKLSERDEDCFVVYDGGSIQVLCDLF